MRCAYVHKIEVCDVVHFVCVRVFCVCAVWVVCCGVCCVLWYVACVICDCGCVCVCEWELHFYSKPERYQKKPTQREQKCREISPMALGVLCAVCCVCCVCCVRCVLCVCVCTTRTRLLFQTNQAHSASRKSKWTPGWKLLYRTTFFIWVAQSRWCELQV